MVPPQGKHDLMKTQSSYIPVASTSAKLNAQWNSAQFKALNVYTVDLWLHAKTPETQNNDVIRHTGSKIQRNYALHGSMPT
jgi:hypothetical protein